METVDDRIAVDDKNAFRLYVYNPVMDNIIGEMEKRFSDSNCLVITKNKNGCSASFPIESCLQKNVGLNSSTTSKVAIISLFRRQ
jgi:hypothetical protein